MIRVIAIHGEGFGSIIKPTTYKFQKRGLVIFSGENGVGKTTLFSLLTWIGYGQTLKEKGSVETWAHRRDDEWLGTMGWVKFKKDGVVYRIIRCKDYKGVIGKTAGGNRLLIERDGETIRLGIREAQQEIIKIIGKSYPLFKASVVFGQKMKRFIEEDSDVQKKVLEEVFALSYLSKAKDIADIKLKETNDLYVRLKQDISYGTELLENLNREYQNTKAVVKTFEKQKWDEIKLLRKRLRVEKGILAGQLEGSNEEGGHLDLLFKVKDIQKDIEALNYGGIQESINKGIRKEAEIKSKLEGIKEQRAILKKAIKQLRKDKEHIPTACRRCGAPLNAKKVEQEKELVLKEIGGKKRELKDKKKDRGKLILSLVEVKKTGLETADCMRQYEEYQKAFKVAEDNLQLFYNWEKGVTATREAMEKLRGEIRQVRERTLKVNLLDYKNRVKEQKDKIETLESECTEVYDNLEIYNWVVKEPLSNRGLKPYMFNYFLRKINKHLLTYYTTTHILPQFNIDMESHYKNINITVKFGKHIVPYKDLSGGQAQLVNVLIAFAINEFVSGGEDSIQLLLLDEVFESLSANNIEIIAQIIMKKASVMPVYLITHLEDFMPMNSEVIRFKFNKTTILE